MFIILIVSLLAYSVAGQSIDVATVDVQNNFEFGTVYKSFRVQYPGICHTDLGREVKIQILQISDTQAKITHTFSVPIDERTDPQAYIFGLNQAQPGRYAVKVCVGEECSAISKSLTKIPAESQINELTCFNVAKAYDSQKSKWEVKNKNAGSFNVSIIPVTKLYPVSELDDLMDIFEWKKQQKKNVCDANPCYDEDEGLFVGFPYNIAHFAKMFINRAVEKQAQSETKEIIEADAYCERKYLLSTNVHLLDVNTNQVKYRFKTTLEQTQAVLDNYIFSTPTKDVPIEVFYKKTIVDGTYNLWVSICATEKDSVESTLCARPFVHPNFEVKSKFKIEEEKQQKLRETAEKASAVKAAADLAAADKAKAIQLAPASEEIADAQAPAKEVKTVLVADKALSEVNQPTDQNANEAELNDSN